MSGAAITREQERGRPPPRRSSRDVMPVEVITVDVEDGERRVPGLGAVFLVVVDVVVGDDVDDFWARLKEDMPVVFL